jgi:hypothetical protein
LIGTPEIALPPSSGQSGSAFIRAVLSGLIICETLQGERWAVPPVAIANAAAPKLHQQCADAGHGDGQSMVSADITFSADTAHLFKPV